MKIVHFCTYSSGGAAIAAIRLHEALINKGLDSSIVFLYKNNCKAKNSFDFRDALNPMQQLILKIRNKFFLSKKKSLLNSFGTPPEYFSFPQTVWNISGHPLFKSADIIHFHWMGTFLDYKTFQSESIKGKKLFWTLHDMQPFTGGFHYDNWFGTEAWKEIIKNNQAYIEQYTKTRELTLIAPSNWIMKTSMTSEVFKNKQHIKINNPTSTAFHYVPKNEARKILKLSNEERICFIPADNPDYRRKGIKEFESAIAKENTGITILTSGKRKLELGQNKQVHLGEIADEKIMNLCYNACDVMAFPSLAENFSNTLMEATVTGCPVVCFNAGGNHEIINTNESGIVLEINNYAEMLKCLLSYSTGDEQRRQLSKTNTENIFSIEKTIEKLISLYQK